MRDLYQAFRNVWVLTGRFLTRAFLDDEGAPSIWPFLAVVYTVWFIRHLSKIPEPSFNNMQIAGLFGALIIVIAASLKLGASIIVPIAEAFAQALGKVVSVAGKGVSLGVSAAENVQARLSASKSVQYTSPDRTMPVSEAELARPEEMPWDPASGSSAKEPPGSQRVPDE